MEEFEKKIIKEMREINRLLRTNLIEMNRGFLLFLKAEGFPDIEKKFGEYISGLIEAGKDLRGETDEEQKQKRGVFKGIG